MRYIVGAFMLILIAIIAIVLLATSGNDNETRQEAISPVAQAALHDYAERNAVVRMTTDGEVVGDDEHRAVRITIGRDRRTIDIIKGYQGDILASQTFSNNTEAFETFLFALENAGFANDRKVKQTDDRGVCSSGRRFIYELLENNEQKLRNWSTSCGSKQGTFAGSSGLVRSLFQNQIPEYRKLVDDVDL